MENWKNVYTNPPSIAKNCKDTNATNAVNRSILTSDDTEAEN